MDIVWKQNLVCREWNPDLPCTHEAGALLFTPSSNRFRKSIYNILPVCRWKRTETNDVASGITYFRETLQWKCHLNVFPLFSSQQLQH